MLQVQSGRQMEKASKHLSKQFSHLFAVGTLALHTVCRYQCSKDIYCATFNSQQHTECTHCERGLVWYITASSRHSRWGNKSTYVRYYKAQSLHKMSASLWTQQAWLQWCSEPGWQQQPGTSEWIHWESAAASKRAWGHLPLSGGSSNSIQQSQHTATYISRYTDQRLPLVFNEM